MILQKYRAVLLVLSSLLILPGFAAISDPVAIESSFAEKNDDAGEFVVILPPPAEDRILVNGQFIAPKNTVKLQPAKLAHSQIGQLLGWVNVPSSQLICRGYYAEPNLSYASAEVGDDAPIKIVANQVSLSQTTTSKLSGDVNISQPERSISSDTAYINRNPDTLKPQSVDVYGKVILREPGKLAIGNEGHFDLVDKSGTLSDVIYRMSFGDFISPSDQLPGQDIVNTNTNGWGIAQQVIREPSGVIIVKEGTYTACPPSSSIWHIASDKLTLNKETGRGEATNAALYIKDVPIAYTPYFSFPLDKRRKTGFLYPTFGHSSLSGYDVGIPFYWNIAPNYDATITPDIMTLRGVQLNGEFRYLTFASSGNFHGSFLPDDQAFKSFKKNSYNDFAEQYPTLSPAQLKAQEKNTPGLSELENDSNNRYFVSLKDARSYNANWSSYLYVNHVSDDYYFEDFSNDPAQLTENQILNEADLFYSGEHWNFMGQLQGYQTLHPFNQTEVANQYRKLPELNLNGQYPGLAGGFNFAINNQFDDFFIDKNPNDVLASPDGTRLFTNPDLSYPKYWIWGYIKPDAQLTARQYNLKKIDVPPAIMPSFPEQKRDISSAIPILDIDMGLFFERNFNLFNNTYQQTFEPRLFYLYVPYHEQNDIPLFDTTVEPFTFSQLFRTNRFTGIDRIGDTDQISLAVTSRFINENNGDEKVRASIGQIYYFEKRRVMIDENTLDLVTYDNQVANDAMSSPIAAELNYYVSHNWSVMSDLAWDPNYVRTNNANIMFQYKTDNQHIVNLGYSFLRGGDTLVPPSNTQIPENSYKNNLNQTDLSVVWPLGHNWSALARWNYNVSHNYPQTYFGGLEYDACCWSFRTVVGRDFNYLDEHNQPQFNHEIYFQIALKTLGSLAASSPTKLLKTIPGYVDDFGGTEKF